MAKTDSLASLDLNKNELQNAVLQNLAAAPDTPKKGQFYFDTAAGKQKYYNGTKWLDSVSTEELNSALNNKVDKVSGKALSTNDFTNDYKTKVDTNTQNRHSHSNKSILDATTESFLSADKTKLNGIATGAQVNVIETVKVNNSALTPSSKAVNITVPTKVSQLTNDSNFATQTYVTQQISSADKLKKAVVESLPASNIDTNTIYLVKKSSGEAGNVYNEYMYINSKWELIGDTKTDLTGYVRKQSFSNPELTPSGGVVTWTVTHTLNTQDLCASIRRVSDNASVLAEIAFSSATQVVVKMNAEETVAANTYKISLMG